MAKNWKYYSDKAAEAFEVGNWKVAIQNGRKALETCPDSEKPRLLDWQEYYEQAPKNKICIYTICRNESKFVDKWVESHKTADKMVAVVHDCTDDTEEKLRKGGVLIKKDSILNWRFDVGKTCAIDAARELAPDCNILVYASLDERFEPGWDLEIRKYWRKDTDQACYKFVQAIGPHNEDRLVTHFVWMTSNDPAWYYIYPVHEAICRVDGKHINLINLFDKVKLRHYQDCSKPKNYQSLCEVRYKEFPNVLSRIYLSRELCVHGRCEESIELIESDCKRDDSVPDDIDYAYLFRILGDDYFLLGKHEKAIEAYSKAKDICPTYNDAYIGMGRSYCFLGRYAEAEEILKQGLRYSVRAYSWTENSLFWEAERYSWLAGACYKQGKKHLALLYAAKGLSENPDNELSKDNFITCSQSMTDLELGKL